MTNKERLIEFVSQETTETIEKIENRKRNRDMIRESQRIAIKVITKIEELGWSRKELATRLDVSPQQVSKITSGKENLTIETQIKLQQLLDIPILASYYEAKSTPINSENLVLEPPSTYKTPKI